MKPPPNFLDGFGVIAAGMKQIYSYIKTGIGGTLSGCCQYIYFMSLKRENNNIEAFLWI